MVEITKKSYERVLWKYMFDLEVMDGIYMQEAASDKYCRKVQARYAPCTSWMHRVRHKITPSLD